MDILKITRPDRKWYEVILWWEIRRILYNLLMCLLGFASFFIGYVNIPLVYLVIGFGMNVVYTLGWVIELILKPYMSEQLKISFPKKAFIVYVIISTCFIFGIATYLLFRYP